MDSRRGSAISSCKGATGGDDGRGGRRGGRQGRAGPPAVADVASSAAVTDPAESSPSSRGQGARPKTTKRGRAAQSTIRIASGVSGTIGTVHRIPGFPLSGSGEAGRSQTYKDVLLSLTGVINANKDKFVLISNTVFVKHSIEIVSGTRFYIRGQDQDPGKDSQKSPFLFRNSAMKVLIHVALQQGDWYLDTSAPKSDLGSHHAYNVFCTFNLDVGFQLPDSEYRGSVSPVKSLHLKVRLNPKYVLSNGKPVRCDHICVYGCFPTARNSSSDVNTIQIPPFVPDTSSSAASSSSSQSSSTGGVQLAESSLAGAAASIPSQSDDARQLQSIDRRLSVFGLSLSSAKFVSGIHDVKVDLPGDESFLPMRGVPDPASFIPSGYRLFQLSLTCIQASLAVSGDELSSQMARLTLEANK